MTERVVKTKRDGVCTACRRKIKRGSKAAARKTKYGHLYFCMDCYRKIMENDVFVYPFFHSNHPILKELEMMEDEVE